MGREVPAPSRKEFLCIRAAQARTLEAHVQSLHWGQQEVNCWGSSLEAQDPGCPLLPRSPPQMHYRVGGTRGQGLLNRGPTLSLPSITGSSNAPLALKAQTLCS